MLSGWTQHLDNLDTYLEGGAWRYPLGSGQFRGVRAGQQVAGPG